MRFMDVVHNGVLQAFRRLDRHPQRSGREISPERARRLLEYKGERIERNLIGWLNQGHTPQIIWD